MKELDKMISNLDNLRALRAMITPTELPKEKEITALIQQAQIIRRIFEALKFIFLNYGLSSSIGI